MVFWCGGGLFSAPEAVQRVKVGQGFFCTASEGTLESFLVRFRGLSALHCHSASPSFTAMVFWCGGRLFSAPDSVQWEKVGKRLLFDFVACPSITAMVFWCGGVSTTGKGWQNWQKAIFNRVSEGTLETFLVRFRGVSVFHCHGVLVWRRAVFSTGGSTTGKGWQNWQKAIFNRVSEGTLETFLVRFRGVSVFHCHGVLVWRRAVFSTGGSTTGKSWGKATFYWVSEGTLESFLVRFRGLSVLPCHGVLVWRRAVFSTGFING